MHATRRVVHRAKLNIQSVRFARSAESPRCSRECVCRSLLQNENERANERTKRNETYPLRPPRGEECLLLPRISRTFPVYPILAQVGVLIFNSWPEGTYSLQSVWPSPVLPLRAPFPLYAWLLEHYLHVNLIYARLPRPPPLPSPSPRPRTFYKHRIEERHRPADENDIWDTSC